MNNCLWGGKREQQDGTTMTGERGMNDNDTGSDKKEDGDGMTKKAQETSMSLGHR